jgi:propanol-preferring alcohol dehydrogenase
MANKMMKAAVLTKYGSLLEIKEVPIPHPGPNDVLVKLIACGICHTDLHGVRGGKINIFDKLSNDMNRLAY